MEKTVSDFNVSVYQVRIKSDSRIMLPPFPGTLIRGAFGMALRRATCVTGAKDCQACMLNQTCVYATSFETIVAGDSPFLKGVNRAPHPLIVYPLETGKSLTRRGATYTLGLTVFGNKRDYLPYYIFALSRLGETGLGRERGKFRVVSVREQVSARRYREIYDADGENLSPAGNGLSIKRILEDKRAPDKLRLEAVTPLRLKSGGKYLKTLNLRDLLFAIATRLRLLSALYADAPIDLLKTETLLEPIRGVRVLSAAFGWHDFSRYSRRQKTRMKLGGLMGVMTLAGNLGQVMPLLRVGRLIHIGKNTGFGLGQIRLHGE